MPSDVKALLHDYWFSNENNPKADDDPPFLDVYYKNDGMDWSERDTSRITRPSLNVSMKEMNSSKE